MVLAVAVLAGAVYVAASPGAQQAGPTAKQFKALEKKVAKLQKQVSTADKTANLALGFTLTCVAHQPLGVDSVGTTTEGYLFGAPGTPPVSASATSALSLAAATETTPQYRVFVLNTANSGCVSIVNGAASTAAMRLFAAKHR
jgi:hypothetical protein